ncbi:MAG: AraC family transcriptional regulator [Rouxiella aceris]|jgi:AraC-like DNA-binding protein|uniref:Arabinose operon regulatory protein n=1 Tax=Rouxiella aceris TaxID=2703884 RepID=A0A848MR42_9GAMM|nr:AraC family transcriptional regulator [Rouxiella aceris]MDR3430335.1 AraC family transcriptional regulator [Rouxiella aceris]NMP28514.1 AraC family transcriptional regulator [Rouxiella aceris]
MLKISVNYPVKVQNGGLFISRGIGTHPTRTLSSHELIFVLQGTLALREGNKDFKLNQGESLLLFPGREHKGLENFDPELKFYWLHFDILPQQQKDPCLQLNIPQHCKIREVDKLITLFRLFLHEQERGNGNQAQELLLLLLLQEVARAWPDNIEPKGAGVALAYKARQMILTHYHQPLAARELATRLHCNADYLGRVFRLTFQMTLTEALHKQRVSAAEKLLLTASDSVAEIAMRTGFNDVAYFRRIFRKTLGLTPAAYKKLYCREHINSD